MSELDVVDFVGGGDSSFDVAFCCIGTTLTKVDRVRVQQKADRCDLFFSRKIFSINSVY